MKTDKEFLNGMWDKVSLLEYEETQRKAAQIRHKKIMLTNIVTTLSIIIACILFIILKPPINQAIFYITATIALTAAYHLDKFIAGENKKNSERVNLHEN